MMKLKDGHTMLSPKKLAFSLAFLAVMVSLWMLVSPLWGSGRKDAGGNLLFSSGATFSDAGVHLSLIGEQLNRFPPTNFAFGGVALKNYHYLFDTFMAAVVKLTGLSPLDVYFRVTPVGVALLLTLGIYLTTLSLTGNKLVATFSIFVSVMSTSLGFFLSHYNNVFMADQIYELMYNPQGVASLVIFLALFLILNAYEKLQKKWLLLFFVFLLGLSFGVKAYGGVVFVAGSIATGALFIVRKRDPWPFLAALAGVTLMAFWIVSNLDGRVTGVTFAPGWLLLHLMTDYERLNLPRFALLLNHYPFLYLLVLGIYLLGSLGWRVLGLLAFRHKLTSEAFLLVCGGVSFLTPILFNQGKKPYDIIQFTPYFTLLMGIMLTVFFKNRLKLLGLLVVVIFLMNTREISQRLTLGQDIVIPKPVVAATDYIRLETNPESVFLLSPGANNWSTLWFAALAQRRTVYSGRFFNFQVGVDTAEVEKDLERYFATGVGDFKYDYILSFSGERTNFDKIRPMGNFKEVFTNEAVTIWQKI